MLQDVPQQFGYQQQQQPYSPYTQANLSWNPYLQQHQQLQQPYYMQQQQQMIEGPGDYYAPPASPISPPGRLDVSSGYFSSPLGNEYDHATPSRKIGDND